MANGKIKKSFLFWLLGAFFFFFNVLNNTLDTNFIKEKLNKFHWIIFFSHTIGMEFK